MEKLRRILQIVFLPIALPFIIIKYILKFMESFLAFIALPLLFLLAFLGVDVFHGD